MWDLLYKRYANPMMLLQNMLDTGRMADFITEFTKTISKENQDKYTWELWLHKVFDMEYDEFLKRIGATKQPDRASKEQLEATVKKTKNILDGFVLEQ